MQIAITGAAGYLGTEIIKRLCNEPKIKSIIAIDRAPVRVAHEKVKSVVCDINSPRMSKVLSGCSVVVHLAYIIGDSTNRPALYRVNVDGSKNVFEAAAEAGAKRLIVASSVAAYGYYPDNPAVVDEHAPLRGNPDNAYSDTKRLVELMLDDFEKRYLHITVVRFRPGVILGPNTRGGFRTLFELPIWMDFISDGPGFFSRTAVVHEDDVVNAFVLAIKGKGKGAYNLAVEPFVTREQILKRSRQLPIRLPASLMGKLMALTYKLKLSNSPPSDLMYMLYPIPASGKKAMKELGWRPKYSGLEALDELLKSIREKRKPKFLSLWF